MLHLEDGEQRALIQWAQLWKPPGEREPVIEWLFAIPGGGKRGKIEAKRFKGLGVKAGVSDLFLAYVSKGRGGLWIEMKKKAKDFDSPRLARAAVTKLQRGWLNRMDRQGYKTAICYGADEAIQEIKDYFE